MKEFELKTKSGEVINKTKANDLEDAINIFAKIKDLVPETLIKLFLIEEIEY